MILASLMIWEMPEKKQCVLLSAEESLFPIPEGER